MSLFKTLAGPVLGMAGDIFSAHQQAKNQQRANEANARLAAERMQFEGSEALKSREFSHSQARQAESFSAAEATRQMEYQERMSNTSYQRAIADMKKAGINPMFAVDKGGASTPSGASGTGFTGATAKGSGAQANILPVPSKMNVIMSGARDAIHLMTEWKQALAASEYASAKAEKTGVEKDLLEKSEEEKRLNERIYKFINNILDRLGQATERSPLYKSLKEYFNLGQ